MPRILLFLMGLIALNACSGGGPEALDFRATDPNVAKPELGKAYSAFTDEYLATCVDASALTNDDYLIIPPNTGDLKFALDMTAEEIRSTLGGDVSAKIDMETLDVSGALAVERDAASNNLSSTMTVTYNASNGKYALKDAAKQKLVLTAYGQRIMNDPGATAADKARACGTHVLTGIGLAASFTASLRFDFASESAKDAFHGQMQLAMKSFELNGRIDASFQKVANHASTTLTVTQMGGDVTRLGATLNEHVVKCNADTHQSCLAAMEGIIQYLHDDFPKQLLSANDAGTPDPYRYWLKDPELTEIEKIEPRWSGLQADETLRAALKEKRSTMNQRFLDMLQDKARARAIYKSGVVRSLDHRNRLLDLMDRIDARLLILARAISPCYNIDNNAQLCIDAVDGIDGKLAAVPVDLSLLVVVPQSFVEYCAQMRVWFSTFFGSTEGSGAQAIVRPPNPNAAEQDMTADIRDTLTAMLNIDPVKVKEDGRMFSPTIPHDAETPGYYSPAGEAKHGDGTPYYLCPALDAIISNLHLPVTMVDVNLKNIEPLAAFESIEDLDISKNRIQAGIAAIGQLQYLNTLKARDSKIISLKGIANANVSVVDLSGNLIQAKELPYLTGMDSLRILDLSRNDRLRSLTGLANLPSLEQLTVRGTRIDQAAMTAFLTNGYAALGSTPTIFWDTPACDAVKQSNVPNKDRLRCGN